MGKEEAMRAGCLRLGAVLLLAVYLVGGLTQAQVRAESPHVFGIHFWDWGANLDVMSHRTGWVVEANLGRDSPNVSGRINPATGEGFTIVQRLDWDWDQTVPVSPADQNSFAYQCRNWANNIKKHCRHYVIGNEMELHPGVTVSVYASTFQKVRNQIRSVQPEAQVIIGHWNSNGNLESCMQTLGPDGYDGIAKHTGSDLDSGLLDLLDQELGTSRPDVGLYITEWGWVVGTVPEQEAYARILGFYEDIGQSNASRLRQLYCACWFSYPSFLWQTFSLKLSGINGHPENPAFESATALGTSLNAYADNPVIMSDLFADIPDSGSSIQCRWHTNVPARPQIWWKRVGQSWGESNTLSDTHSTVHELGISGLWTSTEYEVMPTCIADDHGDAGGRRFRAKTGPWSSDVTATGAGRVRVHWPTDWPTDSLVEYGPTSALGQSAYHEPLVTEHSVQIAGLEPGHYHYRVLSSEPNPDPNGPRLHLRSPIRTFEVELLYPGDLDRDCDVDQEDFGLFQVCYSGPGIPPPAQCEFPDFDGDGDVDHDDFGTFQDCMSGPNVCADPGCASR